MISTEVHHHRIPPFEPKKLHAVLRCFSLSKRFKFWRTELVTRFIAKPIRFPIAIAETLAPLKNSLYGLEPTRWFGSAGPSP